MKLHALQQAFDEFLNGSSEDIYNYISPQDAGLGIPRLYRNNINSQLHSILDQEFKLSAKYIAEFTENQASFSTLKHAFFVENGIHTLNLNTLGAEFIDWFFLRKPFDKQNSVMQGPIMQGPILQADNNRSKKTPKNKSTFDQRNDAPPIHVDETKIAEQLLLLELYLHDTYYAQPGNRVDFLNCTQNTPEYMAEIKLRTSPSIRLISTIMNVEALVQSLDTLYTSNCVKTMIDKLIIDEKTFIIQQYNEVGDTSTQRYRHVCIREADSKEQQILTDFERSMSISDYMHTSTDQDNANTLVELIARGDIVEMNTLSIHRTFKI